jgi:glutamate N-acetyltransferase/amino-acid N-acetyltransferase
VLAATGSVPLSPTPSSPTPTLDPKKVSVSFIPSDGTARLPVLIDGEPEDVDEDRAKEILSQEEFEVEVDLGVREGTGEARYWTCDFSYVSGSVVLFVG